MWSPPRLASPSFSVFVFLPRAFIVRVRAACRQTLHSLMTPPRSLLLNTKQSILWKADSDSNVPSDSLRL